MTYQQTNNPQETISKKLSIQISLSGLSFCILNEESNTIDYLKQFPLTNKKTPFQILDKLKALFEAQDVFNQKFDSVVVIYVNELATLVPKALFKEEQLADYLKFNSKILKSDFISYDEIQSIEAVNVYVPYININNFIYDHFGDFTYKHFSTVLIERLKEVQIGNTTQSVYVNISDVHFEIIAFKNGDLQLYNTFEYNSKEDFIYYLLFTIEQLSLNPERLDLIFLGEINETDAIYKIAYKYIRNVRFLKRMDQFNFKETPVNPHSNFALINSF